MVVDAWYGFSDLTGDSSVDPVPGADFAVYYLVTPNVALDAYVGANFLPDEVASFTPDSLVLMPALPKLSDIYLGALGLKNDSLSTRSCV